MMATKLAIPVLILFVTVSASVAGVKKSGGSASRKGSPPERQDPVDDRTVRQHADARSAQRIISNSIDMKLVYIEPGEFLMGSLSREKLAAKYGGGRGNYADEEPVNLVLISEGFWIGRTEVTRGQFRRFAEETGYETTAEQRGHAGGMTKEGWGWVKGLNWQSAGIDQTDDHPVVQVSWFDAVEFCKWLSKKEQRSYALPTEAQWEYACRAGSETAFPWGDEMVDGRYYGNMVDKSTQRWIRSYKDMTIETSPWDDDHATTAPVASFKSNAWGLYDMHGNVCEWCSDWYGNDYYLHSMGFDPKGPVTGALRVLRGGSWVRHPRVCRSASRHSIVPTFRSVGRGFRVVLLESPN